MRAKIIDDDRLLAMHKEGKSQKEIAAFFNVSPVAVCKRLKRLLPSPESVLDKYDLTKKERAFVMAKSQGKTNTEAALESYEVTSRRSAKVIGSQLMGSPTVNVAIDELMDHHGLTKSYRVLKLKQHIDNRDPNVSLKALDQTFKLDGSYKPEDEGHRDTLIIINSIAELQRQRHKEDGDREVIEIGSN